MTRKIVSEMTYNVSMGTLNPTIPYHASTYVIATVCSSTMKYNSAVNVYDLSHSAALQTETPVRLTVLAQYNS